MLLLGAVAVLLIVVWGCVLRVVFACARGHEIFIRERGWKH